MSGSRQNSTFHFKSEYRSGVLSVERTLEQIGLFISCVVSANFIIVNKIIQITRPRHQINDSFKRIVGNLGESDKVNFRPVRASSMRNTTLLLEGV